MMDRKKGLDSFHFQEVQSERVIKKGALVANGNLNLALDSEPS